MSSCASIDALVTPYVDGELAPLDCKALETHLRLCPSCHSRVEAERAMRELLQRRKASLSSCCASRELKARCSEVGRAASIVRPMSPISLGGRTGWTTRLAPLAVAASLVVVVGGAFVYQATVRSSRVMAAELTADHVKCFALNAVLRTHQSPEAVRTAMLTGFDWPMMAPTADASEGLQLVGSRPCLYGEGKVAHIMYRHHGRPVSLFMLPRSQRPEEIVKVLGHECAIWSVGDRTFVLVAREARADVERLAALVQASLR